MTLDLAAALREVRGGALARMFVVPERRVLFMSLNKNACTSLQWMMADLAGEDLDSFTSDLRPFVVHEDAVHDRRQWKVAPRLQALDPQVLREIHPDNGWFVFAVVRDPRLRIFSAWQNKLLLDHPGYSRWRSEPWYPRHPVTAASIVEDFARFTRFLELHPDHELRARDAHFRSQVDLLVQDVVPYSHLYDLTRLADLRADLTAHLDAVGRPAELYLPRANHTPLHANAALFGDGVRERIEQLYAADLDQFGDRWDFEPTLRAPDWSASGLAEVDLVASMSRRMAELRELGIAERRRADDATKRAKRAGRELRRLQAENKPGLAARVRSRLRP